MDDEWLEQAIRKHPNAGHAIMLLTCIVALWFYTIKAYFDTGWRGGVIITFLTVPATAVFWLLMKLNAVFEKREVEARNAEANGEVLGDLGYETEDEEDVGDSSCVDCGAYPEFHAARMARGKYGVNLCAPCYTKRSNTPDTNPCSACGSPIHTADPISETSVRFKGRLLCQMCYSNDGKEHGHIVRETENGEVCDRCEKRVDKVYADRANGPYLCANCWRDPYSETKVDPFVLLARRRENGELTEDQYLAELAALVQP